MGKSALMVNLVNDDILNHNGIFFLDPHGDAIDDLMLCGGGAQMPGSFSFRRGGCTTGPKQVKGCCSTWGPACLARPA
jgi:hypothetical protein